MKFLKDDSGYVIPWFGKVGHFLPRDEIVFGIKSNLTLDNTSRNNLKICYDIVKLSAKLKEKRY